MSQKGIARGTGTRLLLVDNQTENLNLLKLVLGGSGYDFIDASSGREALRHLLETDFAVILLDVHMPDMDGFETAQEIRSRDRTRSTPIIFITAAEISRADLLQGYGAGGVDYIGKPIVPEILQSKVRVFVELFQLRQELESKAAQLKAANQELETFSFSVSHDLKAPLRHIGNHAGFLVEELQGKVHEENWKSLKIIDDQARRLSLLIDKLLEFAFTARTELKTSVLDLNAIVKEVVERAKATAAKRVIHWTIDPLPPVHGDPVLLGAVFENLISNAVKYTGARAIAEIKVGFNSGDGVTTFFVRDNGAGFNMKYADKLFGVFQRMHSDDEFPGIGIGLANVRKIIERHGGKTWAKSESQKGSTFFFSLPE